MFRLTPLASAALLGACAGVMPSVPSTSGNPADPQASVPAIRYNPATAGTVDYRPVDPKPWGAQNDLVNPATRRAP
jgi:hypothetical protein